MTNPFKSPYQEFIYKSRYARWRDYLGRRENWDETVDRVIEFYSDAIENKWSTEVRQEVRDAIYNLDVMPSMRAMMTAGAALARCNVAGYNCAYLPVDHIRSFDEAMYILLCGTGVGFSVESKYVRQLPIIPSVLKRMDDPIIVEDSKEGWADAIRRLIEELYNGRIKELDVSKVRPAGARLKTFGGRASGPEPLVELASFITKMFFDAAGRQLATIEAYDIMCKIASVVVVGGVRRSAMICLFDCTDDRMLRAKFGNWWEAHPWRALANNSAVYERRRPDAGFFMQKWKEIYDSGSGEPGIFSRYACQQIAARNGRRYADIEFGTNPCSEIILRPYQFCNLSEIVVRADDTVESLSRKARVASILGTIQSSFTDFNYLRPIWRETCEEERLLGVSLTGICDNRSILNNPEVLGYVKNVVVDTNKEWAGILGINQATATTCVKPSGTVSQLVDSASGMHTRHSPYYIRRVRGDIKDPLTAFMRDNGVPCEQDYINPSAVVFSFAIKSPEGAMVRSEQTAVDALNLWKGLQDYWCEHKPSVTVSLKEDEWLDAGAWLYKNFDSASGISVLPYNGGTYQQAPYEEITEEQYNKWVQDNPMPKLDWSKMTSYESYDQTTGSQELACTAGGCEIV